MTRIAHVDVNAFYCSCERVFRPDLTKRPILVLSNGDGCVVARDAQVKALGIPMGQPWFELKRFAREHGIVAFSSNYTLYGDMSRRVMSVIEQFSPDVEVYSIDEAFIDLTTQPDLPGAAAGHVIRNRVLRWTGLPVCVGIGATKTLAKLADWMAKHDTSLEGVCDLTTMDPAAREHRFQNIAVREVWGIGRRLAERLRDLRILTVGDLVSTDARRLREQFSVVLERTIRELQGEPCNQLEQDLPSRKQIVASRTFSASVTDVEELAESIREYMGRAAVRLRFQGSVAGALGVWIGTNRFRTEEPQHNGSGTIVLPKATEDSGILTASAVTLARKLFKPGHRYWKSGVMLLDIAPKGAEQLALFDTPSVPAEDRRSNVMHVMDSINDKWRRDTLGIGTSGLRSPRGWSMRRRMLSPRYTTEWTELPVASA